MGAYAEYCRTHDRELSPLYFRPVTDKVTRSRTFKRAERLFYCPGNEDGEGAHIVADGGRASFYVHNFTPYDIDALCRGDYQLKETPEVKE